MPRNKYDGSTFVIGVVLGGMIVILIFMAYLLWQVFFVNNTVKNTQGRRLIVPKTQEIVGLREVDYDAFLICNNLARQEPFIYYNVQFYINSKMTELEVSGFENGVNFVYLHPVSIRLLSKRDLETLVIHGLAHIYLYSNNQIEADKVAAIILGSKSRIRNFLISLGLRPNDPRIIALSSS